MNFGLTTEQIGRITKTLAQNEWIDKAVIYGSRAKGNFRPGSDIDLCLYTVRGRQTELNKLAADLDDLLLPFEFDLSIHHLIDNPEFLDHIHRVGIVFYQKPLL